MKLEPVTGYANGGPVNHPGGRSDIPPVILDNSYVIPKSQLPDDALASLLAFRRYVERFPTPSSQSPD